MTKMGKITVSECNQASLMLNDGKTLQEIGRILRRFPDNLSQKMRRLGIKTDRRNERPRRRRFNFSSRLMTSLYVSGATAVDLSKKYGCSVTVIQQRLKESGVPARKFITIGTRRKISLSRVGSKNPAWRGDRASYSAVHSWVRRNLVKPKLCQSCQVVPPLDVANISQKYLRDLSDYEWLCRKCHMKKDGRLKNLHQYSEVTK